jgi:hypothetical protein
VVNGSQGNRPAALRSVVCVLIELIATVREIGSAAGPVGVTLAGANEHVAPAGMPPLQAKIIVEWNPSRGIAVSTIGADVPPRATVVVAPEDENVKVPTEARIFSTLPDETLGR